MVKEEEKIFNIVDFPEVKYFKKISKLSDEELERKYEKLTGRGAKTIIGRLMRRGHPIYKRDYNKNTDIIYKMEKSYYLRRWIGTIDIKEKIFKIK
jgi:hypothetical protein